jgi:methionine-rich copper-binding protein CopC
MKSQTFRMTAITVLAVLSLTAGALAHAFLDHADPKVGSTPDKPPTTVRIWFTEEIEPDFSSIQVRDSNGKEVDNQDSKVDTNDKKLLTVSLANLPPGKYQVHWHVVASDTHTTEGDFSFTVKASS